MIRFALGYCPDIKKWYLFYVDDLNVPVMHIVKMDSYIRDLTFDSMDEAISHLNTFAAGYKIQNPDVQFKIDDYHA